MKIKLKIYILIKNKFSDIYNENYAILLTGKGIKIKLVIIL